MTKEEKKCLYDQQQDDWGELFSENKMSMMKPNRHGVPIERIGLENKPIKGDSQNCNSRMSDQPTIQQETKECKPWALTNWDQKQEVN